jgi:RNA exonuclease 4
MEHSKNWKALQARLKGQSLDTTNTTATSTTTDTTQPATRAEELWFEVDEKDYKKSLVEGGPRPASLLSLFPPPPKQSPSINKYLALDCEYVGVGPTGTDSALARITLVNWHGHVVMDHFVRPKMRVTDYRTHVSGVRSSDLVNAVEHDWVLGELERLIGKETVLVGHGLENDMRVMMFHHPRRLTRDTSKYRPFRALARGKTPSLKRLAKHFLSVDIQAGEHDSAEDARAAMLLYQSVKREWENYLWRQEGKVVQAQKRARRQSARVACD